MNPDWYWPEQTAICFIAAAILLAGWWREEPRARRRRDSPLLWLGLTTLFWSLQSCWWLIGSPMIFMWSYLFAPSVDILLLMMVAAHLDRAPGFLEPLKKNKLWAVAVFSGALAVALWSLADASRPLADTSWSLLPLRAAWLPILVLSLVVMALIGFGIFRSFYSRSLKLLAFLSAGAVLIAALAQVVDAYLIVGSYGPSSGLRISALVSTTAMVAVFLTVQWAPLREDRRVAAPVEPAQPAESRSEAQACDVLPAGGLNTPPPGLVTAIAVADFVLAAISLLTAAGLSMIIWVIVRSAEWDIFVMVLVLGGAALVHIVSAVALPVAGVRLLRIDRRGRRLQVILARIGLVFFVPGMVFCLGVASNRPLEGMAILFLLVPLGTIFSPVALLYLGRPAVEVLFAGKTPRERTTGERVAVRDVYRARGTVAEVVGVSLILLAIWSAALAVATDRYVDAVDRGKTKQTMRNIRSVSLVVDGYAADAKRYPSMGDDVRPLRELDETLRSYSDKELPLTDGWGHDLLYWSDGEEYLIISLGKGNEPDASLAELLSMERCRDILDPTEGIVFRTNGLILHPEGISH